MALRMQRLVLVFCVAAPARGLVVNGSLVSKSEAPRLLGFGSFVNKAWKESTGLGKDIAGSAADYGNGVVDTPMDIVNAINDNVVQPVSKDVVKAVRTTATSVAAIKDHAVQWTSGSLAAVAAAAVKAVEATTEFAGQAWNAILDFFDFDCFDWKMLMKRLLFGNSDHVNYTASDVDITLTGEPHMVATIVPLLFGAPREVDRGAHSFSTEGSDLRWSYTDDFGDGAATLTATAGIIFSPEINLTVMPIAGKVGVEFSGEVRMNVDISLNAERAYQHSHSAVFPEKALQFTACAPFFCITLMLQGVARIETQGTVQGFVGGWVSAKYDVDGTVELDLVSGDTKTTMNAGTLSHKEEVNYESSFSGTVSVELGPVFTILPTPGAPILLEPKVRAELNAYSQLSGMNSGSPSLCGKVGINVYANPGIEALGFPSEINFDSVKLENAIIDQINDVPTRFYQEALTMLDSCTDGATAWLNSALDSILDKVSSGIRQAIPDISIDFVSPLVLIERSVCFNVLTIALPDKLSCGAVEVGCGASTSLNQETSQLHQDNEHVSHSVDYALCSNGILSGSACCASSCGSCGGSGCDGRPGEASNCCIGTIKQSGKVCSGSRDVGCVIPEAFIPKDGAAIYTQSRNTRYCNTKYFGSIIDNQWSILTWPSLVPPGEFVVSLETMAGRWGAWGKDGQYRMGMRIPGSWLDVPGHDQGGTPYEASPSLAQVFTTTKAIGGVRLSTPTWHHTDSKGTMTVCMKEAGYVSFRLRGQSGQEEVVIRSGSIAETHSLTTSFQTFTYPWANGVYYVDFTNDAAGRDVFFEAVETLGQSLTTTLELPAKWSDWNCGSNDENVRCHSVRSGKFGWTGQYKVVPPSVSFRLRGTSGEEEVTITIDNIVSTHRLTTSFQTFTYPWPANGFYHVGFTNDAAGRDVIFDAVKPTNNALHFTDWSDWNCGSNDENWRCDRVRSGSFGWPGHYTVTPKSAVTTSTTATTTILI